MTRTGKLKCWVGNLDGEREGMIIATSKTAAQRAIPTGRADFDAYWTEIDLPPSGEYEPLVLYTRDLLDRRLIPVGSSRLDGFVRGRCKVERRS